MGPMLETSRPFLDVAMGAASRMCTSAGRTNPSVFPEPVSAMAMASRPSSSTGQHCDWMPVGALNPSVHLSSCLLNPACANDLTGA